MSTSSTPDVTRAQLISVAQAAIAVVVAFGAPITDQQSIALVALAAGLGSLLVVSDAAIRRERARNFDKIQARESRSSGSRSQEANLLESAQNTGNGTQPSDELLVPLDEVLNLVREIVRRNQRRLQLSANHL
jgi:hypothetical protein